MIDRYLTPRDIAAVLGIHRRDVYRLLSDLPRVRIGRRIRVAETALAAYLAQRTERPSTWQAASTRKAKQDPGGATGTIQTENATDTASEHETKVSRENGSVNMSWLRPLKRVGGGSGSRKRSAT